MIHNSDTNVSIYTQFSHQRDRSLPIILFYIPPTTCLFTLSLHDALPISSRKRARSCGSRYGFRSSAVNFWRANGGGFVGDRKSTRLNSSHGYISYAVFCLKKKKMSI